MGGGDQLIDLGMHEEEPTELGGLETNAANVMQGKNNDSRSQYSHRCWFM